MNAIFDFSELPLKMAVQFGLGLVGLGVVGIFALIFLRLFVLDFQLGWPSIMIALIIGFGLQIFFVGLASIYIGKIYKESKHRPLFSAKELTNLDWKP